MINRLKLFRQDIQTRAGYAAAFILLLVAYLLTLYLNQQLLKKAILVDHSNKVIMHLEHTLSSIKDGETALRGFVISKDEKFLEPFKNSRKITDSVLAILQYETKENTAQQMNLGKLNRLINDKWDAISFQLNTFKSNGYIFSDTLAKTMVRGKLVMDSIRVTIKRMQDLESNLLVVREYELEDQYRTLNFIIITSLVITFVLVIYGFITYTKENNARRLADEKVNEYQEKLKERITALDKANKELIEMRRIEKFSATGRIAQTIAHEVRNPLTNIYLALDQLKNEMPETLVEETTVLFDMITRNSSRINQLISNLLNSTKFSELKYRGTSINTLLDETLEQAQDRIILNKIRVEKNYSTDICKVSADDEKLKIAFLNLIINAIEAMEPGKGVLKIITRGQNDKCIVEICDNGSGMDDESLTKLFEPFFTNKLNGNGLGLTNTQNIILNHKGNIHVNSKPGEGTVFIITLNFTDED